MILKNFRILAILTYPLPHWTTPARVYKHAEFLRFHKIEVMPMVDLTTKTIQRIFHRQVQELTQRTIMSKEDTFDYQLSGGWLQ